MEGACCDYLSVNSSIAMSNDQTESAEYKMHTVL